MARAELLIQHKGGTNRRIVVNRDVFTLGRGKECSFRMDDKWASEIHCRIQEDGAGFQLIDNDSKNGTLLNGEPVKIAELKWGDTLQIGQTTMLFIEHDESTEEPNVLIEGEKLPVKEGVITETVQLSRKVQPVEDAVRIKNELSLLHQIVASLNEPQGNLPALLGNILELTINGTKSARGKIILTEENGKGELIVEIPKDAEIHVDARVLEEVVSEREAVLIKRSPESSSMRREYTALCSPIVSQTKVFGVIYLDTDGAPEDFGPNDLELVTTISTSIGMAVGNFRKYRNMKEEYDELKKSLAGRFYMVGESPSMKRVFQFVDKIAPIDSTVLLTGESGTGKELVARAIHLQSPRKEGPLVIVNCAAIPLSLMESELFGYEKGAFTGAYKTKIGKFEEANNGTVLLDEIGEMDVESQAKLLRVIESKTVQRIGGSKTIPTNIRIVASTNKDLVASVAAKEFREDLFFRLNVVQINLPPLRDRREDIPLLVEHFLRELVSTSRKKLVISPEAMQVLMNHLWPGNVRELRNAIERAFVLCRDQQQLSEKDFAFLRVSSTPETAITTLAELERLHIVSTIRATKSNKEQAARALGISRSTLYEKLKLYNIE